MGMSQDAHERAHQKLQRRMGELPQIPDPTGLLKHLIFLLFLVAGALILVAAFGEGKSFLDRLGDSYQSVIDRTTDGTPWTQIMQDNQLYFIVPAAMILVGLGWWLRLSYAGRAVLMYSVFGIGFVGGHVFW